MKSPEEQAVQEASDQRQTEIEALRAKRESIEERRAARLVVDEVKAETAALAEQELLDKYEAEIGAVGTGICFVKCPSGELIIAKKPASATYRAFVDSAKATAEVFTKLVRPCVVHPDKVRFSALLEEYPAVLPTLARKVVELAGHKAEEKD